MLVRIVRESLTRGRRRKLLSAVAVALGITVVTALGMMALDVGDKINRELRSFGANISVTPAPDGLPINIGGVDFRPHAASGAFLAESDLKKLKQIFWRHNILTFAPLLYLPARIGGRPVILIGTWFDHQLPVDKSEVYRMGMKELHPAWRVSGAWPDDGDTAGCLIGRNLAARLGIRPGRQLMVEASTPAAPGAESRRAAGSELRRPGASGQAPGLAQRHRGEKSQAAPQPGAGATTSVFLHVRGILETGGEEDNQVLAPLAVVQRMAGLEGKVRSVQVSALTKPEDALARTDPTKLSPQEFDRWYCSPYARSIAYQINQAIRGAEARPVYPVSETEGRVLDQVGLLMGILAGAALITAALAAASMMLATVLERRTEIGLLKSLGATDTRVAAIFLSEGFAIALVGGVAGSVAGSLLARHLSAAILGSPVGFHWVVFAAAIVLAQVVTLGGCVGPLARGLRISPAIVLRD